MLAEAEREVEQYGREEAQNECYEAEEARDRALTERNAIEAAFAEHIGSRELVASTTTLRRRLLAAEGERDRANALNQRLYQRLWAVEAERDAVERPRA